MPSIVTIGRSLISEIGTTQERVATPARCTVHAPQALMPQPYFVPVIFSSSRRTQSSGVDGSTFTGFGLAINVELISCHGWSPILRAGKGCRRQPRFEL